MKSKTDPFLKWMKLELKRAKKELERCEKRNLAGTYGQPCDDYCDSDWSDWFRAQGRFDAIEMVLTKYSGAKA